MFYNFINQFQFYKFKIVHIAISLHHITEAQWLKRLIYVELLSCSLKSQVIFRALFYIFTNQFPI